MSTAASPRFSSAAIVMGVASCGKTTVGEALAKEFGVRFIEGDRLHAPESVAKMSAGIPLTDEDRWPWLARVGATLAGEEGAIASCSALKRVYRDRIRESAGRPVYFIHLHGTRAVLAERIAARKGHFMPPALLDSQLATLQMPTPDEPALTIDINQPVDAILSEAADFLRKGII